MTIRWDNVCSLVLRPVGILAVIIALAILCSVQVAYAEGDSCYSENVKRHDAALAYLNEVYLDADHKPKEIATEKVTGSDKDKEIMQALSDKVTAGCTTDMERLTAAYNWVKRNVVYEEFAAADALNVYYYRRGSCIGQATLVSEICRAQGIASVWQEGYRGDTTEHDKDFFYGGTVSGHAWLCSYIDGRWIYTDPVWSLLDISQDELKRYYLLDTTDGVSPTFDGNPFKADGFFWIDGFTYIYDNWQLFGGNSTMNFSNLQVCASPIKSDSYLDGRSIVNQPEDSNYYGGWYSNISCARDNGTNYSRTIKQYKDDTIWFRDDEGMVLSDIKTARPIQLVPSCGDLWLQPGDSVKINPWKRPDSEFDKTVKYSYESSDESIATIDSDGTIHAKGYGQCGITTTTTSMDGSTFYGTRSNEIMVYEHANSVKIDQNSMKLKEGESTTLSAEVNPSNTLCELRWLSSNPDVATIDAEYGGVEALSKGKTTITAVIEGDVIDTIDIEVTSTSSDPGSGTDDPGSDDPGADDPGSDDPPPLEVILKAPASFNGSLRTSTVGGTSSNYKRVKLSWSKVSNADGYYIYYKKSGSSVYKHLSTLSSSATTYTTGSLTSGCGYYFKIKPYHLENGVPKVADAYKTYFVRTLKTASKPSVKKNSSKYITLSWSKVTGASGYQVASSSTSSGRTIVKKLTGSSYKFAPVKKKYRYYRIRAYKKVGTKYVYGPWSSYKKYKLS